MISLYTAVGKFERRTNNNGQYPVVIVNGKESMVDIPEMMIWACLNWRILELPQIESLYNQMARDTGVNEQVGCEVYMERLIQRGLIVSGIGDSGNDALYDLLSNLYITPVTSRLFVKVMAFLKFIFINGVPFSKAKTVFHGDKLSDDEKRVVDLAKQTQLSTAELIKCVENGIYDLSNENKVMSALYDDDTTTCDNISYYAKNCGKQKSVLETVANLYLQKMIIFERI
ncbi:MAG: hypothetical protein FWD71_20965 [Oscillospiraceae bacterium]|nr:hypothetical protein [Oscillospiraceae bacterium]